MQLVPGGAAFAIAGPDASPAQIAQLNHDLGLDRPVQVQYGAWLAGFLTGDFGRSLVNQEYVKTLIAERLPVTINLTGTGLLFAVLVGVPLGMVSAARRRTPVDSLLRGVSGLCLALPEFWVAMLAVNLFALQLFWVPATGYSPWSDGIGAHLSTVLLPALTLGLGPAAIITRFTRSAMVEVLDAPYIRTAWALGLSVPQIYFRFAFKPALITIITGIGIVAGLLLGGSVAIERVYVIPGMGDLLVQAILQKDYPIVQGTGMVMMAIIIGINLLVDLSYAALDPRVRLS